MSPQRIHRTRTKGSRLPENTVCVTRGTKWGNPFLVFGSFTKADAVRKYEAGLFAGHLLVTVDDVRRELAGKNLACWCTPGTPCHAEVLLRIANPPEPLAIDLLLTEDERQPVTPEVHQSTRETLAQPVRVCDDFDDDFDDLLLVDPFNGDPPSRRKDSELNRVLSILDELASERGNG